MLILPPCSVSDGRRRLDLCRRVQLVIFWAAYTQKGHTSPKQFFHTIREREPLGPAVLDGLMASATPMPLRPIEETLMSIFWNGPSDDIHNSDKIAPFASPFGPSVLHCAFAGCDIKFYDESSTEIPSDDHVRQMRAQHLKEVFGSPEFETSATGLPEPTQAPKRPSASHCNLHAAIASVWSNLPRKQETTIVEPNPIVAQVAAQCLTKDDVYNGDEVAVERFVSDIRTHICSKSGRGDIYQYVPYTHARFRLFFDSMLIILHLQAIGNLHPGNLAEPLRSAEGGLQEGGVGRRERPGLCI